MNLFSNAYYIRDCFWKAGLKYKWPKALGEVGIGIAEGVFKERPEKFMIKAYKNYYEIDRAKLREFYKTHKQDIYNINGTRLLVIPRSILQDWGRDV